MSAGAGRKWAGAGDGELLLSAARADSSAFAELASRHYDAVYRLAWRVAGSRSDAEDIAQEVFSKLWQDPAQVRQAGALKGWLMRVASNAAIDRLRRKRPLDLEEAEMVSDPRPQAEAVIGGNTSAARVAAAISALPDRQRQALALVYYENMGNIEAAAAMETTVEAVESLLSRARRALRQSLAGEWRELLDGMMAVGE
jgi:RNA polymerase sigma-70 factor (ECF subfamily)